MALPDLPGYERLPGDSARRVRAPSGEIISRRDYEDRRFKASGWKNWREFQDRKTGEYQRFVRQTAKSKRIPTSELRRADSEFNRRYARAKQAGFSSRKPDSPFGKFLVYTGYRTEGDERPIGDTPAKKRRRR